MESFPFFSIIIPTYNRAYLLPTAIESVLKQTFINWELIIIDDGSTDNTEEMVNSFQDKRIHYYYQKNQERCIARNNGISKALGKYICFLDSDDYYLTNRLELLYDDLTKFSLPVAMCYTNISFEKNNNILQKTEISIEDHISVFDFIITAMIGAPQVCISREILLKHSFNPFFHIGEDLELWLRIVNEFPLIYLPNQYTVIATEHEGRSVNNIKINIGISQLKLFNFIFKDKHPGNFITKEIKKSRLSDTYFTIARHYMYNYKICYAFYWISKALLNNWKNIQKKHWIYCLKSLLLGTVPVEYQK